MNVLVIAPHADDEVLGCGGTIVKHVQDGDVVTVILVCDRDTSYHTDSDKQYDIPQKQWREANQCKDVLQYQNIARLRFKDMHVDEYGYRNIISKLEHVYNKVLPDVVYIPNNTDINTDHQYISDACLIVCRPMQANPPTRVLMYEIPSSTNQFFSHKPIFTPNYYIELTEHQLHDKINGLMKYTDEVLPYPNPRSVEGLNTYAQMRGMECNCKLAESFHLIYEKR